MKYSTPIAPQSNAFRWKVLMTTVVQWAIASPLVYPAASSGEAQISCASPCDVCVCVCMCVCVVCVYAHVSVCVVCACLYQYATQDTLFIGMCIDRRKGRTFSCLSVMPSAASLKVPHCSQLSTEGPLS